MAGKKPVVPSSGSVQPSTGAPSKWVLYPGHSLERDISVLLESQLRDLSYEQLIELQLAARSLHWSRDYYKSQYDSLFAFFNAKCPDELAAWMDATFDDGLAVTVADVPGLSTADQTDEAVTSHQSDPYAPNEESGRNIPTVYDGWFISELEAECRFLQVDIPTEFDREDEVYEENLRDFLQQRVTSHQTEVE